MAEEDWVVVGEVPGGWSGIGKLPRRSGFERRWRTGARTGAPTPPLRVTKDDIAAERRRKEESERLLRANLDAEERARQFVADVQAQITREEKAERQIALHRLMGTGPITPVKPPQLRSSTVKVGGEPAVYGPDSDHSWLRDRFLRIAFSTGAVPNRRTGDTPTTVSKRLARHGEQMQRLARMDDAGRELFQSYFTERNRPWHGTVSDHSKDDFRNLLFTDTEIRAGSTAATSLGAMTPPVYLLAEWELWRTAAAPAAARARNRPLPATGMTVNIPGMTSGISVSKQTGENLAVPGSTPTATNRAAAVVTLVGNVGVSQQTLDRVGPGVTFDQIVGEQCAREAATTLDTLVLDAVLGATAQTITNNGTNGIPALWADVGKASSLLKTCEGTRLPPDTLLVPPTNLSWYTAQVDKQTRPIWLPSPAGVRATAGTVDTPLEGFSGYTVGGASVFEDANLVPTETDATLVVGNFGRGVLVMTGPPIVDVFPTWQPAQMTALVRFRQYCAVAVMHPKAFVKISGSCYPVAPAFTGG